MTAITDRLLSLAEVASLTGRSTRTIRRWIKEGKLRAGGFGRAGWIRESDLLHALGFVDPLSSQPKAPDRDTEKDDA